MLKQKIKLENSLFLKFTVQFAMEKISEKIPRRANTIIEHKKLSFLVSFITVTFIPTVSSTENLNAKERKKKNRRLHHIVTLKTTEKRIKITGGEGEIYLTYVHDNRFLLFVLITLQ